jgi:hypothetical protein
LSHWTGFCYADDLTLLAPSADAMRKLLRIRNDYETEHMIKCNSSKGKYITLTLYTESSDRVYPTFYINNAPIERVTSRPNSRNVLHENKDESFNINNRRSKMNGEINDVLNTFGKLDHSTKVDLL